MKRFWPRTVSTYRLSRRQSAVRDGRGLFREPISTLPWNLKKKINKVHKTIVSIFFNVDPATDRIISISGRQRIKDSIELI